MDGLREEEKLSAMGALEYLRRLLGDDFLHRTSNERHPLLQSVFWAAPWSRLRLIELVDALKGLQEAQNFAKVRRKIKRAAYFREAASVVTLARKFSLVGFQVDFEPQALVTGIDGKRRSKRPDFRVVVRQTGEEVFVEVSALEESAQSNRVRETCSFVRDLIFNHLAPAQLTMYGQMSEGFDDSCVDEAVRSIQILITRVKATGNLQSLMIENMEVGIAPNTEIDRLKQWAAERGIGQGIGGPRIDSDELSRLSGKIWDKLAQLPENRPGIIIISSTHNSLLRSQGADRIVRSVEDWIPSYPNICCAVLHENYLMGVHSQNSIIELGQHRVINKAIGTVLKERTVVVFNQKCGYPPSDETRAKISNTFN